MTVTYSGEVATAKLKTLFNLLFFRWRGSVMKLLWRDLLLYIFFYLLLQWVCILICFEHHQNHPKEKWLSYLELYHQYVPLSFVLGFFVTNVMVRWWDQFMSIPWPYSIATYVSSTVHGYDEVGRAMRRTIMRYVCLSLTMVFRVLSNRVRLRFPKMGDLITAGLLTRSELKIIEELEGKFPNYHKNFVPIVWAASIVNRARKEGRVGDDFAAKTLIEELNNFRAQCGVLINYNAICIPLVYLQVVTIAVYSYFFVGLFAQCVQIMPDKCSNSTLASRIDSFKDQSFYTPILLAVQFLVYMGWLKVAETMLNPFGDDDDDFEVNSLIDSNIHMSYLIVDEMHNEHPELLKDQYWNEIPKDLNDHHKEDNNDKHTDVFDIPSTSKVTKVFDAEAPEQNDMNTPNNSDDSYQHLIPNPSIIDRNYQHKADIQAEQSMFRIQRQVVQTSSEKMAKEKSDIDSEASRIIRRKKSKISARKYYWAEDSSDDSKHESEHELTQQSRAILKSDSETRPAKPKDEDENREKKE